jgi:hypothetical protein
VPLYRSGTRPLSVAGVVQGGRWELNPNNLAWLIYVVNTKKMSLTHDAAEAASVNYLTSFHVKYIVANDLSIENYSRAVQSLSDEHSYSRMLKDYAAIVKASSNDKGQPLP